jgi:hypothetical protein
MTGNFLKHPFGEESCEAEVKILKDCYKKFYFEETPFNSKSLEGDCYLIVGRRGTGKTSLSHHFTFQNELKNSRCIDIDEPEVYANVLTQISRLSASEENIAIPRIVKIWEYIFWTLIFNEYKNDDPDIEAACIATESKGAYFIRSVLKNLIEKFLPQDSDYLFGQLDEFLSSKMVEKAKIKMLEITKNKPVIIAMDSLERYSVYNPEEMMSLAALIQCSSNFNVEFADRGVHLKTFISAEVFPFLTETVVSNTLKYVRNPVYMHWRPKDLIRLISWRFYSHLKCNNQLDRMSEYSVDWTDYHDVMEKIWTPYFGAVIINGVGLPEKTFPYILRHTQMRPRQVVVLCNAIAKRAMEDGIFPYFHKNEKLIVETVKDAEVIMANEVINSYASIYPNVSKILDALNGTPNIFKGNWLDKIASRTASEWPQGDYSSTRFKQILAELGIVGVIRKWSRDACIIEADFEYALKDRLAITSEDECVLHPMFFEKYRAKIAEKAIIYPFPNHPDYAPIHA